MSQGGSGTFNTSPLYPSHHHIPLQLISPLPQFAPLHDIAIKDNDLPRIEQALRHHLFRMYYQLLLTDPRQRKVIVCERPLWPMPIKKLLVRLLFEQFQVPSISFAPSHLLSLMTTGTTNGLVIDCGYLESTVLPVSLPPSPPSLPPPCNFLSPSLPPSPFHFALPGRPVKRYLMLGPCSHTSLPP